MLKSCAAFVAAAGLVFTVACAQTDAGVSTNVKTKLAADDTVKAYQIDVDTRNGVVTLTGTVDNAAAKDQAVTIARGTDGVRDVVDQIRVGEPVATTGDRDDNDFTIDDRAGEQARRGTNEVREEGREAADKAREIGRDAANTAERAGDRAGDVASRTGAVVTDAAITSAVKAKFLADTSVKGLKIDVDTTDHVVTLTGTVSSRAEADRAMMLARNTEGVNRVVDNLKVGRY
jgi:hyperosmotically inducible protein